VSRIYTIILVLLTHLFDTYILRLYRMKVTHFGQLLNFYILRATYVIYQVGLYCRTYQKPAHEHDHTK
jgi:hypothetical protein